MIIEKNTGHMAFQFEPKEEFFDLGYKVLNKQQIEEILPCIHVKYNLCDRLLFDIEQFVSLEDSIDELDEDFGQIILYSFFNILLEVGNNGFIPLEAVQVGLNTIFLDQKKRKVYYIVLPIAKECNVGDARNWNKRMWDTVNELCSVLTAEKEEQIKKCLSGKGKLIDNIRELIPLLKADVNLVQEIQCSHAPKKQKELQLLHNGKYGQFAFYVQKREFLIGKRRDSVDGHLAMSEAVSRIHCRIIRKENKYFVIDMGSLNHTFVNGTLVNAQEEKEIVDGDSLRIADIDFKVCIIDI